MKRESKYRKDTLDCMDSEVDFEIEDSIEELAVETPTDSELAKLQKLLQTQDGIAEFLSDI